MAGTFVRYVWSIAVHSLVLAKRVWGIEAKAGTTSRISSCTGRHGSARHFGGQPSFTISMTTWLRGTRVAIR